MSGLFGHPERAGNTRPGPTLFEGLCNGSSFQISSQVPESHNSFKSCIWIFWRWQALPEFHDGEIIVKIQNCQHMLTQSSLHLCRFESMFQVELTNHVVFEQRPFNDALGPTADPIAAAETDAGTSAVGGHRRSRPFNLP